MPELQAVVCHKRQKKNKQKKQKQKQKKQQQQNIASTNYFNVHLNIIKRSHNTSGHKFYTNLKLPRFISVMPVLQVLLYQNMFLLIDQF